MTTSAPAAPDASAAAGHLARRQLLIALGLSAVGAAACTPAPAKPVSTPTTSPSSVPSSATKPSPSSSASPTPTTTATSTPTPSGTGSSPGPTSPGSAPVSTDQVWHLLRRATFGPTSDLVADVKAKGVSGWLDEQLNPALIDDSACDAYLARYKTLPMTAVQIRAAIPKYAWDGMFELGRATLARAVFGKRQLFEVMVEFWSNHLNVACPSDNVWDLRTDYDRDVIRRYALGKFSDLLLASAKSPAMLNYLGNAASSAKTLNENYGRELLELHTVGVDAGYTQNDVVNSAKIMTGFGIAADGTFTYTPTKHFVGPVQVLGFSSPNASAADGQSVAESYLSYLAHHPSTARHLATKLTIRFVSDTPPASLVDTLAQVYLANDTAIVPVLKALFTSPEFVASVGQKSRRPFEDVVAALRAVGVTPAGGDTNSFNSLYWALSGINQAPLAWKQPNGYPDTADTWLSAGGLLGRWNLHQGIVEGWWKDGFTTPPVTNLLGGTTPASLGDLVDVVAVRLLGAPLPVQQRNAVLAFLGSWKVADVTKWRLNFVAGLVLDSPAWIAR